MAIHYPCQLSLLRHPIAQTLKVVQEYLTCFPSPTPVGLDLGIDLPGEDEPFPRNP